MTEKRYYLGYEDEFYRWINDSIEKKNYYIKMGFGKSDDLQEVVDLLNTLHEENMCLKGEVAHYKLILMSLKEEAKRITENWKVRK